MDQGLPGRQEACTTVDWRSSREPEDSTGVVGAGCSHPSQWCTELPVEADISVTTPGLSGTFLG